MRRYAVHDWRSEATNQLVCSPTGGGKTSLACAIGIAACQNLHDVIFTRMDDLARRLVIARGGGIAHQNLLNRAARPRTTWQLRAVPARRPGQREPAASRLELLAQLVPGNAGGRLCLDLG